jgi:hypothetical protein
LLLTCRKAERLGRRLNITGLNNWEAVSRKAGLGEDGNLRHYNTITRNKLGMRSMDRLSNIDWGWMVRGS